MKCAIKWIGAGISAAFSVKVSATIANILLFYFIFIALIAGSFTLP